MMRQLHLTDTLWSFGLVASLQRFWGILVETVLQQYSRFLVKVLGWMAYPSGDLPPHHLAIDETSFGQLDHHHVCEHLERLHGAIYLLDLY